MTSEMMPCPFCGGEAWVIESMTDDNRFGVACKECEFGARRSYFTETTAIAAWNTRTPAPVGELAALAEAARAAAEEIGKFQLGYGMPCPLCQQDVDVCEHSNTDVRAGIITKHFHAALAAHLAEVRAAIGPFAEMPGLPWSWAGKETRREECIIDTTGQTIMITDGAFYGYVTDFVAAFNASAALAKKLEG